MELNWQNASFRELIIGLGLTLLVALVSYLVFRLILRLSNWIEERLADLKKAQRIRGIRFQKVEVLHPDQIEGAFVFFVQAFRITSSLLVLFFAISTALSFFESTRHLGPKLLHYVFDPVVEVLRVVADYLPNIFFIAAISVFTHFLLRAIHFFFREIEKGRIRFKDFYPEWAEPTYKLVRFLVLIFALVAIFPYLPGSGSDAFKGISVFVGLLLSIGSSSAVGNLVAGIILTYMRPFRPGDYVKIGDTTGEVTEKTLLVTRIRTVKNADITVPNAAVLANHIVNYSSQSKNQGLVVHTKITIGYDVPWTRVHEIMKKAAQRSEYILKTPAPFVLQTALNDSAVEYELNAYTDRPNMMPRIYSELHEQLQISFRESGVEILSPMYHAIRDGNKTSIPVE